MAKQARKDRVEHNQQLALPNCTSPFESQYEDILGSYGLAPFIIDGHSLIRFALADSTLCAHDGHPQTLHLVFVIERLLLQLTERGCTFTVAFFPEVETLSSSPIGTALFEIARAHMIRNCESAVCFANKAEYEKEISTIQPPYLLTLPQQSVAKAWLPKSAHMDLGLLLELHFDGSRIKAFVVFDEQRRSLSTIVGDLKSPVPLSSGSPSESEVLLATVMQSKLSSGVSDSSLLLTLVAIESMLATEPHSGVNMDVGTYQLLAQIYLLSFVLKTKLPLASRTLARDPAVAYVLCAPAIFTVELCSAISRLTQLLPSGEATPSLLTTSLADTLDCRFFDAIVSLIVLEKGDSLESRAATLCIPTDILTECRVLWQDTFPSDAHSWIEAFDSTHSTFLNGLKPDATLFVQTCVAAVEEISACELQSVDLPILDRILHTSVSRLRRFEVPNPSSPLNVDDPRWDLAKFATHHFHSSRPLAEPDMFLPTSAQRHVLPRWVNPEKARQREATANAKKIERMLKTEPVKTQLIVELRPPQVVEDQRSTAMARLRKVFHDDGTYRASALHEVAGSQRVNPSTKSKPKKVKKADQIRAANTAKKQLSSVDVAKERFANVIALAESGESPSEIIRKLKTVAKGIHNRLEGIEWVLVDTILTVLFNHLRETRQSGDQQKLALQKLSFLEIQRALRSMSESLTREAFEKLAMLAQTTGFHDLAEHLTQEADRLPQCAGKKAKKPTKPISKIKFNETCSREFQLKHCPEHLLRSEGTVRDARIETFIPDHWQRHLLDVVDAEQSALIVAPTSSGKTFISYYVMERVLRESDDGVVVFVAPTKALLNQVYLEVQARFTKTYKGTDRCVAGVFTRDYRLNYTTAQILVTVPQCLEIMFLSPTPETEEWAGRLRYVIFDEVHSVGLQGGDVWERLMLLSNAPFLALSATLSNADHLHKWMQQLESGKGRKVYKIVHKERFNDLVYHCYDPDATSLTSQIHPCSFLLADSVSECVKRLPGDFKLLPEQCLELFGRIHQYSDSRSPELEALTPGKFFGETRQLWNISMYDVTTWDHAIRDVLASSPPHVGSKVVESLGGNCLPSKFKAPRTRGPDTSRMKDLVRKLHSDGRAPLAVFHMSQDGIEEMAKDLFSDLEQFRREQRERERIDNLIQKQKELVANLEQQMRTVTKQDLRAELESEIWNAKGDLHRLIHEIKPEFTLCPSGRPLTYQDLKDALPARFDVQELLQQELWRMLLYGIAVHHASMDKHYRFIVEDFFRAGCLGVVFATSTLGTGLNMPIKTLVFASSNYIDSLTFRQISGRAGRRGRDLRGDVVFFGFPYSRVRRLFTTPSPAMQGNLLISSSQVVRMLVKLSSLQDSLNNSKEMRKLEKYRQSFPTATASCDAQLDKLEAAVSQSSAQRRLLQFVEGVKLTLEHPLFSPSGADSSLLGHYFRYSVDHLRHVGILRGDGLPNDLSGLVAHLFYKEPGNLGFVHLLRAGWFEKLCCEARSNDDRIRKAMLVINHLFIDTPVAPWLKEEIEKRRTTSKVMTPSLELIDPVLATLHQMQQHGSVDVLVNYLTCYVEEFADTIPAGNALPTTKCEFGGQQQILCDKFTSLLSPTRLRSSFVAVSGLGDRFSTLLELQNTIRDGVYFDPKLCPTLPNNTLPINSYAYDYLMHGQIQALARENRLQRSRVYENLKDVNLLLKAIHAALERRAHVARSQDMPYASAAVVELFRELTSKFSSNFKRSFGNHG